MFDVFKLDTTTTLLSTAFGAVFGSFVLRKITGYSFGIETNRLDKVVAATAIIFASGAITDGIKKMNSKENKKNLEMVEKII